MDKRVKAASLLGALLVVLSGCGREPGSQMTTKGTAMIECDESVYPVMQLLSEEFMKGYPEAHIELRVAEGREAVVDFINDTAKVIVLARELNKEEREALAQANITLEGEHKVALDGVAVIGHRDNPVKELRMGELDSMFAGGIVRWPGSRKENYIELVVGGLNSSTNEVFRSVVMKGKGFARSATPFGSSKELVEYVRRTPNVLGIVGLSWIRDVWSQLTVFGLATPGFRPDSTQPAGKAYAPYQAHIYRHYYPLSRPVFIYSRDVAYNVRLGFISFAKEARGQKVFVSNGLVPVTMPVRLVEVTSY